MSRFAQRNIWRRSCLLLALLCIRSARAESIERWGMFEVVLQADATENPFVDVELSAHFTHDGVTKTLAGFYDGDGTYRIRFMPDAVGVWRYETLSNTAALNGKTGEFSAVAPSTNNHGPVRVADTFHFAYADGARFIPIGTTCYNWAHQDSALEAQTLKTLEASPFNKVRMCVLPTADPGNEDLAERYPFTGTPPAKWEFTEFNPRFFQHLETRIADLRARGIEADLILFHPYGKQFEFSRMRSADDDRYVRYVVARLGAYRNVWWSLANEFDFIREKSEADFDRLFQIVQAADAAQHLRSIHNGFLIYDCNKPWVTHASIQNGSAVEDAGRAVLYRDVWRKPVIFDEVKYEGNIERRWGQLSGEELTHRFWEGALAGAYVTHGEVLRSASKRLWSTAGGTLLGSSAPRIAFLKQILNDAPALDPIDKWQDARLAGKPGTYYLTYFGAASPTNWLFALPREVLSDGVRFHVDVIDTWNRTITPVTENFIASKRDDYTFEDVQHRSVLLPGNSWMALRILRTSAPSTAPASATLPALEQ